MARGKMAAFIIKNKVKSPKELRFFEDGFAYSRCDSSAKKLVFIQK